MLIERIMYAYSGAGDIRVRVALMPEWLRVAFSDDGAEYVIDKRKDPSTSARIILGSVDNFHTEKRGGRPEYCMDFLYDGDLDVRGFLLEEKEAAEEWEDSEETVEEVVEHRLEAKGRKGTAADDGTDEGGEEDDGEDPWAKLLRNIKPNRHAS